MQPWCGRPSKHLTSQDTRRVSASTTTSTNAGARVKTCQPVRYQGKCKTGFLQKCRSMNAICAYDSTMQCLFKPSNHCSADRHACNTSVTSGTVLLIVCLLLRCPRILKSCSSRPIHRAWLLYHSSDTVSNTASSARGLDETVHTK